MTPDSDLVAIEDAKATLTQRLQDLDDAVARARKAGFSWGRIGIALGVTRQATQQRFGKTTP